METRLDRLITLSLTAARRRNERSSGNVPVLMYHGISDEDESGRHAYYRTLTSPRVFEMQMAHLYHSGYTTAGVHETKNKLDEGASGARAVVITFDDGYHDFYVHAFPVLRKYGFTATMFLPSKFIGHERRKFRDKQCMTWNEIQELQESGISFGSHTVTHPQLRELGAGAVNEEVTVSKLTIEQKLGSAVEAFAYPYAFPEGDTHFKSRLREMLKAAGYTCGVCTSIGRVNQESDRYFMRRLPVNSCDDVRLFDAKLRGSYDWVSHPQKWLKNAKSIYRQMSRPPISKNSGDHDWKERRND